jgi:hypothetical protein
MPEPRDLARVTVTRATLEPSSRDPNAAQRRYRAGKTSGKGPVGAIPFEIRNGLPERVNYVYRGLGYDQFDPDGGRRR